MKLSNASAGGMLVLGLATAAWWGSSAPSEPWRRLFLGESGDFARDLAPFALPDLAILVPAALLASFATALYALIGAWVWNRFARPAEERDLAARFGEPYARYRGTIPCWRPSLRPYRG